MSNILILGGAGELGSNFAKLCIDRGEKVKMIDIVRENEAWRLKWLGIHDKIEYIWKSTFDITKEDMKDTTIILDAACMPDRPLGTNSPVYTLFANLLGPTRICETVFTLEKKPIIIYPSSCNVFLGVPKEQQPLEETTRPMPTNFYGWSKLAAEELYLLYQRAYNLPVHIIRTGSCYGPGMRSDQMIAKCIIYLLNNKDFYVKSPNASRTYTYTEDVMDFYKKYLDKINDIPSGTIIHNGGNKENKPYTTLDVAIMIQGLLFDKEHTSQLIEAKYEAGEMLKKPVMQWESFNYANTLLGWTPKHELIEGLEKTVAWFKRHREDYTVK